MEVEYSQEEKILLRQFKDIKNIKWKQCKKCKKYFPLDVLFFMKEKRISDGFENSCRKCRAGRFLSQQAIDNPEKYMYKFKKELGLTKGFFNNKKTIIKYYEKYFKDDILPYKFFITDFFDIIIKYLIEEKYKMTDNDILNLKREWIQEHKLYGYYLRNFNGSIVQMINYIYPNRSMNGNFV